MCLPPHWHVIGAPQVSPGTFFHVRSYQYHVRSYQSLRVIFILSNVDPGIPATCCAILLWRVSRQWASRSCEQQCNCNGNRKSISIRISENMSIAIVRKGLSKCPPVWIISIPWKFISITISIINLSIAIVRKGLSTSMGWDRARGQMRAKAKRRGRGDLGGNWDSWRRKNQSTKSHFHWCARLWWHFHNMGSHMSVQEGGSCLTERVDSSAARLYRTTVPNTRSYLI